jgi:hypothetical protein
MIWMTTRVKNCSDMDEWFPDYGSSDRDQVIKSYV